MMFDAVMHSLPMNRGTCCKFMALNRLELELALGGLLLAVIALTIPPVDASVRIGLSAQKRDQRNRWLTFSSRTKLLAYIGCCEHWRLTISQQKP